MKLALDPTMFRDVPLLQQVARRLSSGALASTGSPFMI